MVTVYRYSRWILNSTNLLIAVLLRRVFTSRIVPPPLLRMLKRECKISSPLQSLTVGQMGLRYRSMRATLAEKLGHLDGHNDTDALIIKTPAPSPCKPA